MRYNFGGSECVHRRPCVVILGFMKLLRFALLIVLLAPTAFAQGVRVLPGLTVTLPGGGVVPFPIFRACIEPATGTNCTPPASLFFDRAMQQVAPNPITGDVNGNIPVVYVAPSRIHLQINGPGITQIDMSDIVADDATQLALGVQNVTASATPTFDTAQFSVFQMTLTLNVTSSTALNPIAGRTIAFSLCQDVTGGRSFTWPASFIRPPPVSGKASTCTNALFYYDAIAAGWRQLAPTADNVQALEYLGSTFLAAGAPSSAVVTIPARDYILCRGRITGYASADVAMWQLNSDVVAADYQTRYIVFSNAASPVVSSVNYCNSGCSAAAPGIPLGDNQITVGRITELECTNVLNKNKVCNIRHAFESTSSTAFNALSVGYAEFFNTAAQITSVNLATLNGFNMFSNSGFVCFGRNF